LVCDLICTNKRWESLFYATLLEGLDTFEDTKLKACHDAKGKHILNVQNIDTYIEDSNFRSREEQQKGMRSQDFEA